ncbi:hypothetical protein A3B87_02070 [Candidatus Kuenenbacteria bacterium RIFCSPHIGHO2_02_FULL_39_13]|uniref:Uncharacterized protein n=1 Tax=Candidatus Kuenenbacteria bacterium RIFCSPHIGHO2_02_FULL_39_13 TaxID=1798561 RepID=A0A1F6FNM1_9BACT|nr:MAG: hypothetical protein A3B87_02070 [Candidatus Kuenenbacteria bacterium RIFCSPHIGHO2_02_FULL_39_13]
MSTATINISPKIYRTIDNWAVKEGRGIDDVAKELLEIGWRIRLSHLDFEWLKMIRQAEEDIRYGRTTGPYRSKEELQNALDELK